MKHLNSLLEPNYDVDGFKAIGGKLTRLFGGGGGKSSPPPPPPPPAAVPPPEPPKPLQTAAKKTTEDGSENMVYANRTGTKGLRIDLGGAAGGSGGSGLSIPA